MINFLKYAVVGISLVLAAPAWASHVSHDDDVVEPFRGVGPVDYDRWADDFLGDGGA